MRTCKECGEEKELSAFPQNRPGSFRNTCKSCYADKSRKWREDNPDYMWAYNLWRNYQVTVGDYMKMWEQQGYRCCICEYDYDKEDLCVDHDHETGLVRGLLCSNCNIGLGMFEDNPQILRAAADYLENN